MRVRPWRRVDAGPVAPTIAGRLGLPGLLEDHDARWASACREPTAPRRSTPAPRDRRTAGRQKPGRPARGRRAARWQRASGGRAPARRGRCMRRFAARMRAASRSCSTNSALRAPRLSASMPSPPEPANRSSTRRPGARRGEIALLLVGLEAALVGQRLEHGEDRALDQVRGRPCLRGGAQSAGRGRCPKSRARR